MDGDLMDGLDDGNEWNPDKQHVIICSFWCIFDKLIQRTKLNLKKLGCIMPRSFNELAQGLGTGV